MNEFSLSQASRASLTRSLSALGGSGPLPVVIVTNKDAMLLGNWIRHIKALGITRFLIVAMDLALSECLSKAGIVAARCEFDGSINDFWLQRLLIWDFLVQHEIHLIQSDSDAVWLRNPIPEHFSQSDFDVLISQGTFHPTGIHARWHFVLCMGLFYARPGPGTKAFFSAWRSRGSAILALDDQIVMNNLLYGNILPGVCDPLQFRIGLLPHSLFQRITDPKRDPFVKHVRRPKDPSKRVSALHETGCWLPPPLTNTEVGQTR
jgi:hypothetical protein